jgi:hypothetical protein
VAARLPPAFLAEVSHHVVQRVDWNYFRVALIVSAMYLFNVSAMPLVAGREALIGKMMASLLTNFPLLTLVYLGTLVELLGLKTMFGNLVSMYHHHKERVRLSAL